MRRGFFFLFDKKFLLLIFFFSLQTNISGSLWSDLTKIFLSTLVKESVKQSLDRGFNYLHDSYFVKKTFNLMKFKSKYKKKTTLSSVRLVWSDILMRQIDDFWQSMYSSIKHSLKQKKEGKKVMPELRNLLLFGPPGTGKTATCNELILRIQKYFPEIELEVYNLSGASVLQDPEQVIPDLKSLSELIKTNKFGKIIVIYIDEGELLLGSRSSETPLPPEVYKAVTEILAMFSTSVTEGTFVVVATNRPEAIDPGILRRFYSIEVPPGSPDACLRIAHNTLLDSKKKWPKVNIDPFLIIRDEFYNSYKKNRSPEKMYNSRLRGNYCLSKLFSKYYGISPAEIDNTIYTIFRRADCGNTLITKQDFKIELLETVLTKEKTTSGISKEIYYLYEEKEAKLLQYKLQNPYYEYSLWNRIELLYNTHPQDMLIDTMTTLRDVILDLNNNNYGYLENFLIELYPLLSSRVIKWIDSIKTLRRLLIRNISHEKMKFYFKTLSGNKNSIFKEDIIKEKFMEHSEIKIILNKINEELQNIARLALIYGIDICPRYIRFDMDPDDDIRLALGVEKKQKYF